MVPIRILSLYCNASSFRLRVHGLLGFFCFCFFLCRFLAISSTKLNVPVSVSVCVGTGSLLSDSGCFDGNSEAFAHEILQLFFESTLE